MSEQLGECLDAGQHQLTSILPSAIPSSPDLSFFLYINLPATSTILIPFFPSPHAKVKKELCLKETDKDCSSCEKAGSRY